MHFSFAGFVPFLSIFLLLSSVLFPASASARRVSSDVVAGLTSASASTASSASVASASSPVAKENVQNPASEADVIDDIPSVTIVPGGGIVIEGSVHPVVEDVVEGSVSNEVADKVAGPKADRSAKRRARIEMFHSMALKEAEGELKVADFKEELRKRKLDARLKEAEGLSKLGHDFNTNVFGAKTALLNKKRDARYSRIASARSVVHGSAKNLNAPPVLAISTISGSNPALSVVNGETKVSKSEVEVANNVPSADVAPKDVLAVEGSVASVAHGFAPDSKPVVVAEGESIAGLRAKYRKDARNLKRAIAHDVSLINKDSKLGLRKIRHDYGLMLKNSISVDFGTQFIFSGGVDTSSFFGPKELQQLQAVTGSDHLPHMGQNFFSFSGSVGYTRAINRFLMLVVGVGSRGYNNDLLVQKADIPKPSVASTNAFVGLGVGLYRKGPFIIGSSVGAGVSYLSITKFSPLFAHMLGLSEMYGVGAAFNFGLNFMYLVTRRQTLAFGASVNAGPMFLRFMGSELGYIVGGNFDLTHRFLVTPEVECYYRLGVNLMDVHGGGSGFAFTNYLVSLNFGAAYRF